MDKTRFEKLVEEGNTRREELMKRKGKDYDKVEEDRLSSFKIVAKMQNLLEIDGCKTHTGSGLARTLLLLKIVRDANLRRDNRSPENESRLDSKDDMHNYIDLDTANEIDELLEQVGQS